MSVPDSEKLGVSVLGCQVNEKVEYVPIKKRRHMLQSVSPPPRAPTLHPGESKILSKNESLGINNSPSMVDMGEILDIKSSTDDKNFVRIDRIPDGIKDLSGISMLVAAAHGKSSEGDDERIVEGYPFGVSMKKESCSLSKGVFQEDVQDSSEIPTNVAGSCISAVPVEDLTAAFRREKSLMDALLHANNLEGSSAQDHSGSGLKDNLTNKDERPDRMQKHSSGDERLHWDLNTDMDAWEFPFDYQSVDCQTDVADEISGDVKGGTASDEKVNSEISEMQVEPGAAKHETNDEMHRSNLEELEPGACTHIQNVLNGDLSQLHDDRNISNEKISSASREPRGMWPSDNIHKDPTSQLDEFGLSQSHPTGFEMVPSSMFDGDLSQLPVNMKVQQSNGSNSEINKQACSDSEEQKTWSSGKSAAFSLTSAVCDSCVTCGCYSVGIVNISNKMDMEHPLRDGYDYDDSSDDCAALKVSGDGKDHDVEFEDGEVRESIIHTGEYYDGEDLEADNLGFDAEQLMENTLDRASKEVALRSESSVLEMSENADNKLEAAGEKGIVDSVTGRANAESESQLADSKTNISEKDQLDFKILDALTGISDGISKRTGADMYKSDAEDTEARRASRIELQSHVEENGLPHQRSRKTGYVDSFSRGRYTHHAYPRRREADRWVDYSNRGFKHHHSTQYPGSRSFHRIGTENGFFDRESLRTSSPAVRQHFTRIGSPDDRDQTFSMHRGRHITFGRGRSGKYIPRDDWRGPRRRYLSSTPNGFVEPPLTNSYSSSRRDRSISPAEARGIHHVHRACTKSPLRSRTRSPDHANSSSRHRSRSPTFRSEVGMQRLRSPSQRSGFVRDHVVGFRSMLRNNGSPPRNSKWFGDRNNEAIHFRERRYNQHASFLERSPRRSESSRDGRFGKGDFPKNYRSMHMGKFSDIRGNNGDRYGLVHTVNHFDTDESRKRFFYGVEEGVVKAQNFLYRDASDRRGRVNPKDSGWGMEYQIGDVPKKLRGAKDFVTYQEDEKNEKSTGKREVDGQLTEDKEPVTYQQDEKNDAELESCGKQEGDSELRGDKEPVTYHQDEKNDAEMKSSGKRESDGAIALDNP
ncbi:uncharacterized protein LOC120016260 isoform X2 [Tripterygium wilfordii]|uniref:uncharacterized protein LOC120016260 isoform X2 n=1 Tax=Tripterygium wilfordii TaxID=458696 RepID=UPI0018F86226|nr:uncharacterized protein LOC120016260 isoform X2 [Tripterygium wilfordii]